MVIILHQKTSSIRHESFELKTSCLFTWFNICESKYFITLTHVVNVMKSLGSWIINVTTLFLSRLSSCKTISFIAFTPVVKVIKLLMNYGSIPVIPPLVAWVHCLTRLKVFIIPTGTFSQFAWYFTSDHHTFCSLFSQFKWHFIGCNNQFSKY